MIDKDFVLPAGRTSCLRDYWFVFFSLFIILAIVYGNSLDCSWHFDDYRNIVDNANVHLHGLSWDGIKRSFAGLPDEGMKRPLSYLSFALNYYIGNKDVFGYHLVNLLVHYITAVVLFLFIHRTLNLPLLKERYGRHSYSIALLSTFFWALHPIQVSTVTYIVQRMAGMAAMFFIMAMLFYLHARTADKRGKKVCYFVLSVLSGLLALAAKENAGMLPLVIFLYDLVLIRGITRDNLTKYLKFGIIPLFLIMVIAWFYLDPKTLLDGYQIRPFTMGERLLTQPRVIIFYITLLLYPLSSRFSLLHDVEISSSLFSPWTTLPAIILVFSALCLAFLYARKKPLLSFCVIFFFLNHLVEGSILPLEMIYEHRNYLPSLLFFVPLSALTVGFLDHFSDRKAISLSIAAFLLSFMMVEGTAVILCNEVMKNEFTLWLDNAEKSPRLHRPHHNLAMEFLAIRLLPEAFTELQRALDAKVMSTTYQKYNTYFSLGQYYRLIGDDDRALEQFEQSIKLVSFFPDVYQSQSEILMARGQFPAAEMAIRRALTLNSATASFHVTYGELLLKKGDINGALSETRKALILNGASPKAYGIMAEIFEAKKDFSTAAHFLLISQKNGKLNPLN
jgi:protein O-mannosyl-transferase